MRQVAIVQPYVPAYRVPLFDLLWTRLLQRDIQLTVWHGVPGSELAARNDAASADWSRTVSEHQISIGSRHVRWRALQELGSPDLLVLEQALGNLEGIQALLKPRSRRRTRIALWGHGRTYTHSSSALSDGLKQAMTRRADWFFSYTQSGAAAVASAGFPPDRITVLNNSVETSSVRTEMASVTPAVTREFRTAQGLGTSRAVAYVGGLDESKRIPFLLDAFEAMLQTDPDLVLLIAGDGRLRESICTSSLPLRYLGRVGTGGKAILAQTAQLMLCPGRVGLVAVDSFAMELPLVTTRWRWHAPEFEYLHHGVNAWVSDNDAHAFAHDVTELLNDPGRIESLRDGCRSSLAEFTLEAMADRFVEGISQALELQS